MLRPTKLELEDPFFETNAEDLERYSFEDQESLPLDTPEEPTLDAWDYAGDIVAAPFRGVAEAGRAAVGLADAVTGGDLITDTFTETPWLGRSKTTAGSVVEGISEFATGFIPFLGILGKAGKAHKAFKLGKVAKGAVAGGLTDLVAFQGLEGRLSDMVQSNPALDNPITAFLASDPDDTEIEGRLKNALEGVVLGGAIDGIMAGIKALKVGRAVQGAGGSDEAINNAVAEAVSDDKSLKSAFDEVETNNAKVIPELPETPKKVEEPALTAKEEADAKLPQEVKDASDSTVDKFLDVDNTLQLKAMARNENVNNLGNFKGSTLNAPEDIQNLAQMRADVMLANDTKLHGRPTAETLAVTYDKTQEALKDIMGEDASFEMQMKLHDKNIEESQVIIYQAQALAEQLGSVTELMRETATAFKSSNSDVDLANALRYAEMATEIQSRIGGYKYTQGLALGSNRKFSGYIDHANPLNASDVVEAMQGGKERFASLLNDIAMAGPDAQLGKMLNDRLKNGKWTRVHNEMWLNSILSGLKTHTVQIASNTASTAFLPAEGWLGAMAKGDRKSAQAFAKQYTFMMESVSSSFHFAKQAWKKGEGILDSNASFEGTNTRNISAENFGLDTETTLGALADTVGNAVRLPTKLLMSTDEFFKQLNFRSGAKAHLYKAGLDQNLEGKALDDFVGDRFKKAVDKSGKMHSEKNIQAAGEARGRAQGKRGADLGAFVRKYVKENYDPTNTELKELYEASEYASMLASEATFTTKLDPEGNILEQASVGLQRFGNKQPLFKLLVPFVTTPVNLVKFVGQRTLPMGKTPVLSDIHARYADDLASGDALRASKAKGRVATGAMMWTTSAGLAASGLITGGGPDDHNERKILEGSGWQPWSLKLGDTYVSYNRTEPFGTFLGLVAGFTERLKRGLPHEDEGLNHVAMSGILAFTDNITDRTYMSGFSDILDALSDPAQHGGAVLRNRVASYIPSLLNGSKPLAGDTAVREVRDNMDALINRTPFGSKTLDPRRNILGEVVEAKMFGEPLTSMANPLTMSRDKGDAVFTELAELHHGFSNPSPLINGSVDLLEYANAESGQTAYDRYVELSGTVKVGGKTLHQSLARLVKSSKYKRLISTKDFEDLDDVGGSPRVREITRIIARYRSEARKKVSREYPEVREALRRNGLAKEAIRRGSSVERIQSFLDAT